MAKILETEIEYDGCQRIVHCHECKENHDIEYMCPRILAGTKKLVLLCHACHEKDLSQFPHSALYNFTA